MYVNGWILDPFAGSSTTGIAANLVGRRFLGIEKEAEFAAMSKERREEIEDIKTYNVFRSKIKDIEKTKTFAPTLIASEEELFADLPF